ncbi:MAG TPA: alpha/beta fold hydrolase [Candidatus Limnocylindria bacterium]|nr:alpha/beta fold hydrolase [Candidatus Limnocylindria bacterium]
MRLHVHEFGPSAGRTVVALHGVTGLAQVFRRLAHRMPGFRLVAPDLRGHGESGKEPPWDLSVHLRDIRETLDAMGISRAPFIGYSFGGRLAVEMLAAERSRIEKLVLLEPALQMQIAHVVARTDELLADTSWASVEDAIAARLPTARYAPREHFEIWSEALVARPDGRLRLPFSRAAAIAILGELSTPPPPFASLRLPTLLIVGAESQLVTPKQIERYAYDLGDFLEVKTVRAGHQLIGDAADDVAAAVNTFLAH